MNRRWCNNRHRIKTIEFCEETFPAAADGAATTFAHDEDLLLHHDIQNNVQQEASFSAAVNYECDANFLHHHHIHYRDHEHLHLHDWAVEEPVVASSTAAAEAATTTTAGGGGGVEWDDATQIIYENHRKLLHLLSHPKLFIDAMIWQSKVDRGIDPMSAISNNDGSRSSGDEEDYCYYDGMIQNMEDHVGNGIESFEKEFQNDVSSSCSTDKNDDDSTNIQNENDGTDSKPIIHNSLKACALVRSGDEGNNNRSSNNNKTKGTTASSSLHYHFKYFLPMQQ